MDYDLIVIGGGISGMSFAHYATRSGLKTLVVEKEQSAGGCIQSPRLEGGFWFELGAHTCYNSYRALIGILEARALLQKLLKRERVPFRLLVNGDIRSIMKEVSIPSLLMSAHRIATTRKEGNTIRGYYSRILGKRNYDRVFGPFFSAVPSQKADDFPADMLFKSRERRKDILRSFSVAGGLQTIIDSIAGDPNITVQADAEVSHVEREAGSAIVKLARGGSFRARRIAVAVAPPIAAVLLTRGFPEAAAALSRIQASEIHSFGIVVRRDATSLEPVAGIIPLDHRFFSMVSRDTVPDPDWRGFAFHFGPGTGRDDAIVQMCSLLKLRLQDIRQVFERRAVLASPRPGHREIIRSIDERIAGSQLFVTGNYFGGLAIEDCVIRSQQEAARLASSL